MPNRKLILQMQMSVDGFVESSSGEPWQVWNWSSACTWDRSLQRYFNEVYASVDTILLSRAMAEGGFIDHWRRVAVERPGEPGLAFAKRVGNIEKIVLTRNAFAPPWERTRVITGERQAAVRALKSAPGAGLIAFGGTRFASKLLELDLVDELQLFINPAAVGAGSTIFSEDRMQHMKLLGSQAFGCGIVVSRYAPKRSGSSNSVDAQT